MTDPLWLSVARAFVGTKEIPGPQSAGVILQWAKDIGAPDWFDNDDKAWCAVWLNRVMLACQLPMAGTGFELLRAKAFESWGQSLTAPVLGAILVFRRPEGAHVGLYVGEDATAYRVLGANQSNAVGIAWIAKERLTAIRWPVGLTVPADVAPVLVANRGSLSTDEA